MRPLIIKVKDRWLSWLKLGVVIWIFGISTIIGFLNIFLMLRLEGLYKKAIAAAEGQPKYTVSCEDLKTFSRVLDAQQKRK